MRGWAQLVNFEFLIIFQRTKDINTNLTYHPCWGYQEEGFFYCNDHAKDTSFFCCL